MDPFHLAVAVGVQEGDNASYGEAADRARRPKLAVARARGGGPALGHVVTGAAR